MSSLRPCIQEVHVVHGSEEMKNVEFSDDFLCVMLYRNNERDFGHVAV